LTPCATAHYGATMKKWKDILLEDVEAYLERHGISATAFGVAVTSDRHLVHRLRRGSPVSIDTADRIRQYMHNHPLPAQTPRRRRGNVSAALAA